MINNKLLRLIVAVVIGFFISIFTILLIDALMPKLFGYSPMKQDANLEEMQLYANNMNWKMYLSNLISYAFGSFMGAYSASRFTIYKKMYAGLTIGFMLLLGGITSFFTLEYPIWFMICSLLFFGLFSFFGAKIGSN